jgi:hypothetical protein
LGLEITHEKEKHVMEFRDERKPNPERDSGQLERWK